MGCLISPVCGYFYENVSISRYSTLDVGGERGGVGVLDFFTHTLKIFEDLSPKNMKY
jgi:hypothetical protein